MGDSIAAEWQKLVTARSTRVVLGTMGVLTALTLGIAWYFVATWDGLSPEMRAHASLGSLPDLMGWIASLVMAVFGTLAITSEFSSGMIRTTFVAMPRRSQVLAAKAVVVAVVALLVSGFALAITLVGSACIVGTRPIGGQTPLDTQGAAIVLALALSTAMFSLVGLGLGACTRSGIASVVSLALLWYVGPLIATHTPPPWSAWLSSLVPGALAGELAGTGNANSVFGAALTPIQALVAMLLYAFGPLIAGGVAVTRTDA